MPDADTMTVFDRRIVRRHRDRAAPDLGLHDFLLTEVAQRLAERLDGLRRQFPLVLDLGCHGGEMAPVLKGRSGIETIIHADLSPAMARLAATRTGGPALAADEEFLPLAPASLDLVVSNLSLHWVNDLPGALLQIRRALRPDGLFLAAMLGGDTLIELRRALLEAEAETAGGVSPRVSPMAGLRDAAGLLQRAGFALPVADSDTLTVSYPDPLRLIRDLRGMGETNAVLDRLKRPTRPAVLARALDRYGELFREPDGTVPATFQVLYLAGWAPDPGVQQQPARRGSADARLADALRTEEIGTGVRPDGT
ncbi:methyltransferase domain-containing protein [Rhodospirillum centenum]|uniref:Methyltransferase, putative n=1 Tax=Rhodospirillum centenum (strain ATCC 51521 / SW) TaxID=414684 RepID=B6IUV5_RHOCS|nr:methyltransferase domain-containing protein [Rhodospirillum centenum]ACJ00037.1 methyltransferase, putative [Rhodospirillum centenum SW]